VVVANGTVAHRLTKTELPLSGISRNMARTWTPVVVGCRQAGRIDDAFHLCGDGVEDWKMTTIDFTTQRLILSVGD
jgi:hypothetical protein